MKVIYPAVIAASLFAAAVYLSLENKTPELSGSEKSLVAIVSKTEPFIIPEQKKTERSIQSSKREIIDNAASGADIFKVERETIDSDTETEARLPQYSDPRPFPSDLPKNHVYLYEKATPLEVQQRLEEDVLKIPAIKNLAMVSEVQCKEDSCALTISQDLKDRAAVQSAMMEFLTSHEGDYGAYLSFDAVEGDPTATVYTFNKESLTL